MGEGRGLQRLGRVVQHLDEQPAGRIFHRIPSRRREIVPLLQISQVKLRTEGIPSCEGGEARGVENAELTRHGGDLRYRIDDLQGQDITAGNRKAGGGLAKLRLRQEGARGRADTPEVTQRKAFGINAAGGIQQQGLSQGHIAGARIGHQRSDRRGIARQGDREGKGSTHRSIAVDTAHAQRVQPGGQRHIRQGPQPVIGRGRHPGEHRLRMTRDIHISHFGGSRPGDGEPRSGHRLSLRGRDAEGTIVVGGGNEAEGRAPAVGEPGGVAEATGLEGGQTVGVGRLVIHGRQPRVHPGGTRNGVTVDQLGEIVVHLLFEPRTGSQVGPAGSSSASEKRFSGILKSQITIPVVKFETAIVGPTVEIAIFSAVHGEIIPISDIPPHRRIKGGPVGIQHPVHAFPVGNLLGGAHGGIAIDGGFDHRGQRRIIITLFRKTDGPVAMEKDGTFVAWRSGGGVIPVPQFPSPSHTSGVQPVVHVVGVIHEPGIINFKEFSL